MQDISLRTFEKSCVLSKDAGEVVQNFSKPCHLQASRSMPGRIMVRLLREERGQALVVWVLCLPIILGAVGLAADVSLLASATRKVQAVADSAATAGAAAIGDGDANAAAQANATQNGITNGVNGAIVTVSAPTSGNHLNISSYVQVIVSRPQQTYFMGVISHQGSMTVSARAVATLVPGQNCIYLLSPTLTSVSASNNAHLTSSTCGILVNSNSASAISVSGSATISTTSVGIVGNYSVDNSGSTISPTPVTGISSVSDPIAYLQPPTYTASSCTSDPLTHYGNGGSSYAVGPGSTYSTTQTGNLVCYSSLTLGSNNDTVTLNPGVYVITGALTFASGTTLGGNGVTFYLTGSGSVTIANNATPNLTAPTSGAYSGVLMYQDRSDTHAAQIEGGASSVLNGALYFPDAPLTVGNGTTTTISAPVVASTLTIVGGSNISETAYASSPISTAVLVE
jgi:Flp pilus assembly protein TadG